MKRSVWIPVWMALVVVGAACARDSATTADDGGGVADDSGGGGDVAPDGPDGGPDAAPDAEPDGGPDVEPDIEPDVEPDADSDVPADVEPDACPGPDPTARENGAYAVDSLVLIRPDVLGAVDPSLNVRITRDDIFVVLATEDLTRDAATFALMVGQALERTFPTPLAQHCTDARCGYPPNIVTTYVTSLSCNAFETVAASDLTFSLYNDPMSPTLTHPTAATLVIHDARISGRFDGARESIAEGVVTGGILAATAAGIYPMPDTTLADLITAAGIAQDYDRDGDAIPDGWLVEIGFEASYIDFMGP